MKKLYFLFVLTFLYSFNCLADHVSAFNLTYRCLGGNTYEISLDFYRDCAGVAGVGGCQMTFMGGCSGIQSGNCFGGGTQPVLFAWYSPSCGYCKLDTFPQNTVVKTIVAPICPSMVPKCSGGTVASMERWTYKKTITLPSQCSDWTFVYGNYARNVSLTTVANAINTSGSVYTTLNNLAAPCNSSPSFASPSIYYMCAGHPFCFSEGTVEQDGDSIVYSLVTPRKSYLVNQYIAYNAGYSYNSPFGAASPITFDTKTGSICVTPAATMTTLTTVKLSEYRNGVLIGSVERDVEFIVVACNNDNPDITGINGAPYLNNNVDTVCAGSQLCFNVNGSDINSTDLLTMSWNSGIAGASFNITGNGTSNPSGQFCWTPTLSDIRPAPYTFAVKIADNACPYEGTQILTYKVYVKNCSTGGPKAVFYSSDTTFCNEGGECIDFFDVSTGSPISWKWTFTGAQPDTSTMQNPTGICYYVPGIYKVQLIVSNAGGTDTLTANTFIIFGSGATLPSITFLNDTLFCSSAASYQWYYNGTPISGATDSIYLPMQNGLYNVYITDSIGCSRLGNAVLIDSVNDLNDPGAFSISPNPVLNQFTVYSLRFTPDNSTLNIYNVLGEKVYSDVFNGNRQTVNCKLPSGIYFISIHNDKVKWISKFIKE